MSDEARVLVVSHDAQTARDYVLERGWHPRDYQLAVSFAGLMRRVRGTRGRRYVLVASGKQSEWVWLATAREVLATTEAVPYEEDENDRRENTTEMTAREAADLVESYFLTSATQDKSAPGPRALRVLVDAARGNDPSRYTALRRCAEENVRSVGTEELARRADELDEDNREKT